MDVRPLTAADAGGNVSDRGTCESIIRNPWSTSQGDWLFWLPVSCLQKPLSTTDDVSDVQGDSSQFEPVQAGSQTE